MTMYAGTMQKPEEKRERFVYVEMTRAQFDTYEGKLKRGDVIVIPEAKALRWVYRARIAKPSTKEDWEEFNRRHQRARIGSRLRNQPLALPAEDENPFEYAEDPMPESLDDSGEDSVNLGDRLQFVDDPGDGTEDEGDVEEDQESGVYDARIERAPGEETEDEGTTRRGRRRARRSQ